MFQDLSATQKGGLSRLQKSLALGVAALVLFSLVRGLFYLLYSDEFAHLTLADTVMAFANGLRFDAAVVARVFAIPLLLMNLPLALFDARWWFNSWAWMLYLVTLGLVLLCGMVMEAPMTHCSGTWVNPPGLPPFIYPMCILVERPTAACILG